MSVFIYLMWLFRNSCKIYILYNRNCHDDVVGPTYTYSHFFIMFFTYLYTLYIISNMQMHD